MTTQPSWVKNLVFPSFFKNKYQLFVILLIVVVVLSLMPQEKIPKVDFDKIDLIVHLIMYAALAYAICMALFDKIVDRSLNLWWVPISLGIFGLGIEVLQVMLPINRFFSWEDAASNFIGACSFFAWIHFIRK